MDQPFDIFGADALEPVGWPDRPRYLLSYAYAAKMTDDDFAALGDVDVILDSGAFTAMNSGKPVDHDAFLEWVGTHAPNITAAFTLDVIGDPSASARNHREAVRRLAGVDVDLIPTWHIGSSWHHFEAACDASTYVAVGGAVPHFQKQSDLARLSANAHDIAAKHGTRLHGLGMTGRRVMYQFPWWSVDSSSWAIPARMPLIYLANEDGRMTSIQFGRPLPPHHEHLVTHYGGDARAMEVEGFSMVKVVGKELATERQTWAKTASARSYQYVEARKQWATGHPFKVYLAATPRERIPIEAHALGTPWPHPTEGATP